MLTLGLMDDKGRSRKSKEPREAKDTTEGKDE